jgi:hypothetical protein
MTPATNIKDSAHCPSALAFHLYMDAALESVALTEFTQHVQHCARCSVQLSALQAEQALLRGTLQADADMAPIPAFKHAHTGYISLANRSYYRPANVAWALSGLLAVVVVKSGWQTLSEMVPASMSWLNPLNAGNSIDLFIAFVIFTITEGTAMFTSLVNYLCLSLALGVGFWVSNRSRLFNKHAISPLLLCVLLTGSLFTERTQALDIRKGELSTVAATETIEDTLFIAGDTIVIDGNVHGDVWAFGRSITINGSISGTLIGAGETLHVNSSIEESVFVAGSNLIFNGAQLGANLVGFGKELNLNKEVTVAGNAVAFANTVDVAGNIGVDLHATAASVQLAGRVQRNVKLLSGHSNVLGSAFVGGNFIAMAGDTDNVTIVDGATIVGSTEILPRQTREREPSNKVLRAITGALLPMGMLFISGLALLWMFPSLRQLHFPTLASSVRNTALGFVAAVAIPALALVLCVTLLGLPLGLLSVPLYLAALWLAKIVTAQFIGRALLRKVATPHFAVTLLAGLVVLTLVLELPMVGGVLAFLVTLFGLGVFTSLVFAYFQQRRTV